MPSAIILFFIQFYLMHSFLNWFGECKECKECKHIFIKVNQSQGTLNRILIFWHLAQVAFVAQVTFYISAVNATSAASAKCHYSNFLQLHSLHSLHFDYGECKECKECKHVFLKKVNQNQGTLKRILIFWRLAEAALVAVMSFYKIPDTNSSLAPFPP